MVELFSVFLFQNTVFLTAVPIYLIEHIFRQMLQFYNELQLICLPRADSEIFGNKKFQEKLPIEMHGRNLSLFFIKNTNFSRIVPIYSIEHIFRQIIQFYNGLQLKCLSRANFEIFGNKKFQEKLPIEMHGRNLSLFFVQNTNIS